MELINTFNKITDFEKNNPMYMKLYDGYNLWPLLRNYLYTETQPKVKNRRMHVSNKKLIFKVFKNQYSNANEHDNLIVLSDRKQKINGKYVDTNLAEIIDYFDENKIKYTTLQSHSFNGELFSDNQESYLTIELLIIRKLLIKKVTLSDETKQKIINLSEIFKINKDNIEYLVKQYIIDENYYYTNLKKHNVKNIIIPSYYLNLAISNAAYKLNILRFEIQYATLHEKHINYDLKHLLNKTHLPDYMILWSDYFKFDFLRYNNYLKIDKDIKKYKKTTKKDKIIFISQDICAEELFDVACEVKRMLSNFEVVFKQHPWESPKKSDEIEIISSSTFSYILDDINDAKYVVSVFSTTIDQALELGSNVIIYDIEQLNVHMQKDMLANVTSAEEIVNYINQGYDVQGIKPFSYNENLLDKFSSSYLQKEHLQHDVKSEYEDVINMNTRSVIILFIKYCLSMFKL